MKLNVHAHSRWKQIFFYLKIVNTFAVPDNLWRPIKFSKSSFLQKTKQTHVPRIDYETFFKTFIIL